MGKGTVVLIYVKRSWMDGPDIWERAERPWGMSVKERRVDPGV